MHKPLALLSTALAAVLALTACATTQPDGHDNSTFERARSAYLAQDYDQALRLLESEAALGNARAQYTLGYMYYQGQGVPQNMELALQWIREAASRGDPRALEALSNLAAAGMRPQEPANAPAEQ